MLRTVVAIERDGFDVRVLTIQFDVPDENFNLEYAVRKAATDYCRTESGRKVYKYNCSWFNWADFDMNVPSEFCEKHGFKKVESGILSDITVDWDEHLVDDDQIEEDEEDLLFCEETYL